MYSMAKQERAAVVVVTHDPIIAERADRLLEMRDGIISENLRDSDSAEKHVIRAVEPMPPEPDRSVSQPN